MRPEKIDNIAIESKIGTMTAADLPDIHDADALQECIREKVVTAQQSGTLPSLITVTCHCETVDLLSWLAKTSLRPRVYWSDRDDSLECAAAGMAYLEQSDSHDDSHRLLRRMEQLLSENRDDRFRRAFVGTSFIHSAQKDDLWQRFPASWFVIPELTITRSETDFFATVSAVVARATKAEKIMERALWLFRQVNAGSYSSESVFPRLESRVDLPRRSEWKSLVERSLSAIHDGELDKIVLARRTDLEFANQIDPFLLLASLKRDNHDCYSFLFEPESGEVFLGASPERLFSVEGNRLTTEAIAGTIARGANESEDDANGRKLAESAKEQLEQQFVITGISEKLQYLCESFQVSQSSSVMKLANVQHLISRFQGTLRPSITVADIFCQLHPTPAVNGFPREAALEFISNIEPFDRGWYASGVGVMTPGQSDFAVAIRSACVSGSRVSLFAGAGIVEGSDSETEWLELDQKIATAFKILSSAK